MTIVETMVSVERDMCPVAMSIINPRKQIGPDGDRTNEQTTCYRQEVPGINPLPDDGILALHEIERLY